MDDSSVFFGVDIGNKATLLSLYKQNMDEPSTVSTVLGASSFSIPTVLSKKKGMRQWFFGEEAIKKARLKEADLVEDLYMLSLADKEVFLEGEAFKARDLLVIFFKKLFSLPGAVGAFDYMEKLVICLDSVSLEAMELFNFVVMNLNIDANRLMLIDKRESFYYYALSQKPDLFLYNVSLFDYTTDNLISTMLKRNTNTHPQVISLDFINHGELSDSRDEAFDAIVEKAYAGQLISSVYLVGDGFDGEWMKQSLNRLCKGRKVFLGKNLYSKGACYAGFIKESGKDWPFIYIGDNDLKLNLSLKVLDDNEMKFITLIDAGQSWYEAKGECEVILDGEPEIEFYVQRPESREAHADVLELTDMPHRENRTSRLRIIAKPQSDTSIVITITDLGFGEISPSSGKTWEHTISLG